MATARNSVAITPTDGATFAPCAALYCGGAGDVVFKDRDGTQQTWTVAAGGYIMVQAISVEATGTTATGIRALYI